MKEKISIMQLVKDNIKINQTNLVMQLVLERKKLKDSTKPTIGGLPTFDELKVGQLLIRINPNNNFKMGGFAIVIRRSKLKVVIDRGWGNYSDKDHISKNEPIGLANYLVVNNQENIVLK